MPVVHVLDVRIHLGIDGISLPLLVLTALLTFLCALYSYFKMPAGPTPKAFVALKPGQAVSEGELRDFCRGQLAGFKIPKAIAFGELPKTSTGKVQKFVLREREWAGQETRIN